MAGDIELVPHLKGIIQCGAIDVDVCFGEAVDYRAGTNRKEVSATIASASAICLPAACSGARSPDFQVIPTFSFSPKAKATT